MGSGPDRIWAMSCGQWPGHVPQLEGGAKIRFFGLKHLGALIKNPPW